VEGADSRRGRTSTSREGSSHRSLSASFERHVGKRRDRDSNPSSFIPYVRHCLQIHSRHLGQLAGRHATDFFAMSRSSRGPRTAAVSREHHQPVNQRHRMNAERWCPKSERRQDLIVHGGELAIKSPAVERLLARDLRSAIAPDEGRSRHARPVPQWRTRCRPEPCPAADIARRSHATVHRSPERCE